MIKQSTGTHANTCYNNSNNYDNIYLAYKCHTIIDDDDDNLDKDEIIPCDNEENYLNDDVDEKCFLFMMMKDKENNDIVIFLAMISGLSMTQHKV